MLKDKIAECIEYYDDTWLEKVLEQEEILKVDSFTREDAAKLGELCVKNGFERFGKGIAISVFMDGCMVYSRRPVGTGLKNDWWIACKKNTMDKTGVSSLRAHLERATGAIPFEEWCYDAMSYILCGGGFPIKNKHGDTLAVAIISALTHEQDHQLLVDSLAEYLGVTVPSVLE